LWRPEPDLRLASRMSEAGVAPENLEATEAWNGPLFDVWQDFQAVVVSNARAHGDAALVDHNPEPGDRVLDGRSTTSRPAGPVRSRWRTRTRSPTS
jgi:hypothetical protein